MVNYMICISMLIYMIYRVAGDKMARPITEPAFMASALVAGGPTFNPLYKEVKIRIIRGLEDGEWKSGEAIPSETRLAERFDVSIGTIRKAVDELVAGQILVRQQGRGTFVATHNEDRTLFYFFHIVGKDGSKELPVNDMLSFHKGKADEEAEEKLGIEHGARIYRIRSLLKLGGKPIIHDDMVLPAALFPDLDGSVIGERSGTIYGLYQSHYGINVVRTGERLSAAPAPARVAGLLHVKSGTPLLVIKRVAFTYNDMPVESRTSWVNTEHHEYSNDLWKSVNR